MDTALRSEVAHLVADLAAGEYSAIEEEGRGGRLSAQEMRTAILDYGCTLVPLPEDGWQFADEFPQNDEPSASLVDLPLWTKEEGRSDLTLKLFVRSDGQQCTVRIMDILVP